MFGLTLEKILIDTAGISVESETLVKASLTTDAYTPAFDTHDFRDDYNTNEPAASGTYALGGSALTTTEVTVASPAATQLKYASASPSWTGATLTARGLIGYLNVGSAATDMLLWDSDFGGNVSSTAGTFTVTCPANGWWFVDYA
jgi:hypothetical protein